ncbi:hypothetical protein HQQ82_08365 [Rathayibacter sp. VKM Ac-2856]|uniref:hypothetical protein n=1 Tax=unclassified Rathayibacter TaxID=2609250 RepID=UPI0015640415|nr:MULTISPECIES: hypothetical protein [unclassified Rathayibacter]NQX04814.1 hypothetical protein [Rathayibacter sp. VKM Ac-2858]NQX19982.1 hypothetical protein [Rathayibacter sp. VKM Ac-2856]
MPSSSAASPADAPAHLDRRVFAAGAWQLVAVVLLGVLGPIAPLYRVAGTSSQEALGWGTIVVGDVVPTLLGIELVLLAGGPICLIAGCILPGIPREPSRARTALGVLSALLLVVCVPCAVFFSLLFSTSTYSVLPSASEKGCRVVVREFGFLRAAGGSLGLVRPGSVVAEWLEDYSATDGYQPFRAGSYELRWSGETARLRVGLTPVDPVSLQSDGLLDCSR